MKLFGMIHDVDIDEKVISILKYNKMEFFYFQNSMLRLFKRYLYPGNVITLEYDEDKTVLKGKRKAHQVLYVLSISSPSLYSRRMYYDKSILDLSLKQFLNHLGPILFLDLEMTMPPYYNQPGFVSELIQAGMVLIDDKGNELLKENIYVKPEKFKKLNNRTLSFLKLDKEVFNENAVEYKAFYNEFKDILEKYKPTVMVYGKNDILFLQRSYALNELPSLNSNHRFVNLNQLIKNFYNLKSDPGLFKMFEFYSNEGINQIHDALEDSFITYKVYEYFKKDVNEHYISGGELKSKLD